MRCLTEEEANDTSILAIAINRSWAYAKEYNTYTGQVEDKLHSPELRQAYIAGFQEGVAWRFE